MAITVIPRCLAITAWPASCQHSLSGSSSNSITPLNCISRIGSYSISLSEGGVARGSNSAGRSRRPSRRFNDGFHFLQHKPEFLVALGEG